MKRAVHEEEKLHDASLSESEYKAEQGQDIVVRWDSILNILGFHFQSCPA